MEMNESLEKARKSATLADAEFILTIVRNAEGEHILTWGGDLQGNILAMLEATRKVVIEEFTRPDAA
jgi:hypothetical protein